MIQKALQGKSKLRLNNAICHFSKAVLGLYYLWLIPVDLPCGFRKVRRPRLIMSWLEYLRLRTHELKSLGIRIRRKCQARPLTSTCHGDIFEQSSSLCSPDFRATLAAGPINSLAWIDFFRSKRNACNARYI